MASCYALTATDARLETLVKKSLARAQEKAQAQASAGHNVAAAAPTAVFHKRIGI